jgi:Tfp pilus assembly protein PilN
MNEVKQKAQVILEYDREWVRAYFVDSGVTREASTISGIEGISGKQVAVLLSRRAVFHRAIPLPDASKQDSLTVLKIKIGEVFPLPANTLAFDFVPTAEKNENGRVCDVYAAKITDVQSLLTECDGAGLKVVQIVPAVALASMIARKDGCSNGIVAERFGEFVNLDVYQDARLVTFRQVALANLDSEIFRLKAISADTVWAHGVTLNGNEQKLAAAHLSRFGEFNPILDLEPEEYRDKRVEQARVKKHRQSYLVFAAGLVIAAFTANEALLDGDVRSKAEKKAKKQLDQISEVTKTQESKVSTLKPRTDLMKRAFMPAQKSSDVIKVASLLVPKGVWLTGLVVERGKPVQIRGSATNSQAVAAYLDSLTKQKRFRDVRLLFSNRSETEGTSIVQFSITAFPVGNLPIVETGKKKKK